VISLVCSYVDLYLRRIPHLEHPIYNIRKSILYRADCIFFHLILLMQVQKNISEKISSDFLTIDINHHALVYGEKQQLYIFDDIVFHIISLFDYVGNFIGLLYCGQNKMNLKWNGINDSALDKENKFSKSLIASLIKKYHKEWVDPLLEYRSHIIHSKSDSANGIFTITGTKEYIEKKFTVSVPKKFKSNVKNKIENLITLEKDGKLTLIDVALSLVNGSIQIVNEIISQTRQEKEDEWNRNKGEKPGAGLD